MDPRQARRPPGRNWFPRTRGDGPLGVEVLADLGRVSPHTRGWTQMARRQAAAMQGFPAHAGMDPPAPIWPHARNGFPRTRGDGPRFDVPCEGASRFPRTRGDGPVLMDVCAPASTVSPHTRGWTPHRRDRQPHRAGFPAHAGMDPILFGGYLDKPRFPRTRGDGPWARVQVKSLTGVSPHTRGWTQFDGASWGSGVGFPAHAGMDPLTRR